MPDRSSQSNDPGCEPCRNSSKRFRLCRLSFAARGRREGDPRRPRCLRLDADGRGKSICYQVPALVKPGMALVISPLISLMEDQVQALKANGVAAELLNSSQTASESSRVTEKVRHGEVKILYAAPERANTESFLYLLSKLDRTSSPSSRRPMRLLPMGTHDFRPKYVFRCGALRLQSHRGSVPSPSPRPPIVDTTTYWESSTSAKTPPSSCLRVLNGEYSLSRLLFIQKNGCPAMSF